MKKKNIKTKKKGNKKIKEYVVDVLLFNEVKTILVNAKSKKRAIKKVNNMALSILIGNEKAGPYIDIIGSVSMQKYLLLNNQIEDTSVFQDL